MVIKRFIAFAPVYAYNLSADHIDKYITHLLEKENTNRTCNAHLTALKSFCRWLAESHNVPNPCLKIKMLNEDPPKVRVLNDSEYQKVLDVCKPHELNVIRFLAHTGLRSSEFQQLTWDNISPDRHFIKLTKVKGRRQRLIPLNKTCQKCLNNFPRKPNSTTMDFVKSYKSRDSLYRLCTKLARHAGIPKFGPHALRHYFSTALYKKGVPVQFISKILGHADTRTTETIYVHIWPPKDLLGVTDILD
jgi:integrase